MSNTHKANSNEVVKDDGRHCSSDEVLVMSMERRMSIIQVKNMITTLTEDDYDV